MATTKTITVTNQTVSVPEFTERPDARVYSDAEGKLVDGVNANTQAIATYSFGSLATLAAFESALNNYISSMSINEVKNIVLEFTANALPFTGAKYIGTLSKTTSARAQVILQKHNGQQILHGIQNSTTWDWQELALKSDLPQEFSLSANTQKTFTLGSNAKVVITIIGSSTAKASYILNVTSGGAISSGEIYNGGAISIDVSTANKLKVTSTVNCALYAQVYTGQFYE